MFFPINFIVKSIDLCISILEFKGGTHQIPDMAKIVFMYFYIRI